MVTNEQLLTTLMEECAELQQVCNKILNFGVESDNPYTGEVNWQLFQEEYAHITAVAQELYNRGVLPLDQGKFLADVEHKIPKLQAWLETTQGGSDEKRINGD